jgi:hypothetical protein
MTTEPVEHLLGGVKHPRTTIRARERMSGTCFVIQPFDRGPFDKRFHDVFVPAVRTAGLEPYRVDLDPSVAVPIDEIERKIKGADCCLADISIDNPNVWYEVGFANACGKEVVMVCESRATSFPFDVRHRNILTYTTHSPSDFTKLAGSISSRLRACMSRKEAIRGLSPVSPTDGLMPHETTALALLMASRITPDHHIQPETLSNEVQTSGYTEIAASLAVEGLHSKGLVSYDDEVNDWGNSYAVLRITESGVRWCMANQHLFEMRKEAPTRRRPARTPVPPAEDEDDDIPF